MLSKKDHAEIVEVIRDGLFESLNDIYDIYSHEDNSEEIDKAWTELVLQGLAKLTTMYENDSY